MFYVATVYILLYKRRRNQPLNVPKLAVATIMWVVGLLVRLYASLTLWHPWTFLCVLIVKLWIERSHRDKTGEDRVYPLWRHTRRGDKLLLQYLRPPLPNSKGLLIHPDPDRGYFHCKLRSNCISSLRH